LDKNGLQKWKVIDDPDVPIYECPSQGWNTYCLQGAFKLFLFKILMKGASAYTPWS
jgi:hypothetical protein